MIAPEETWTRTRISMPRYLTKTRFKLAQECPTKLFYTGKKPFYPDTKLEDSFLASLAEGGFQVGSLATLYFPGGVHIHSLDHEEALALTRELLEQENVVLFEAALRFEDLFVRVDVLLKRGAEVELIEVKAKSCSGGSTDQFLKKNGDVLSKWRPYLEDVAFQKYVMQEAHPGLSVRAFLMLVDTKEACPTSGLHQKFRLEQNEDGRTSVVVSERLSDAELASPILRQIDVDAIAGRILAGHEHGPDSDLSFAEWVRRLSEAYDQDRRIQSAIGTKCSSCEFHASDEERLAGGRSGFEECWSAAPEWSEPDFETPTILEIGSFRGKDRLLGLGKASFHDVEMQDLGYDGVQHEVMSVKERQWLQVSKTRSGDSSMELRRVALASEAAQWTFPLHFIDFETASPAIPFNEGRHPYGQLAFQFSHHVVHSDGGVQHAGEYIEDRKGAFPNYEFVRALKAQLDGDEGTVFRYAAHENTILAAIHSQLSAEQPGAVEGADELLRFIESICHPTKSNSSRWATPKRDMVDMLDLVNKHYYDPAMGGSSSMKKVLPAVLNGSAYLRAKYSQPIYGAEAGIPSLNYRDQVWVQEQADGRVRDPYRLLPALFIDASERDLRLLVSSSSELREGGAAMTAYARMQFTTMTDYEHAELRAGLLKYCELDTLAMVMVYEAWREWCR